MKTFNIKIVMKISKVFACLIFSSVFINNSLAQVPSFQWVKQISGPNLVRAESIVTDDRGNVYSSGGFALNADFDPDTGITSISSNGQHDIFVQKLDKDGGLLWVKSMGGTGFDISRAITIDSRGNLYITGVFNGTVDFDPNSGVSNLTSAGSSDSFIQKLDSLGNLIWVKQLRAVAWVEGLSIAVDGNDNLLIAGSFSSDSFNPGVDFNPGAGVASLVSNGSFDAFILKLDNNGIFQWVKHVGSSGGESIVSISVDQSNNVIGIGSFQYVVDFDPGVGVSNRHSNGGGDIFILKLDRNGIFKWVRTMGGNRTDNGSGIVTDSIGNIYTTGDFKDVVDFNPDTAGITNLTAYNYSDAYVQKLDSNGNFIWAIEIGGNSEDKGISIKVDKHGNVYTAGYFQGVVNFNPGVANTWLTSTGSVDVFVQKLSPNGNLIWVRKVGGSSYDRPYALAIDRSNNLITTGTFIGTVDFDPSGGIANLSSAAYSDAFIQKMGQCQNTFSNDVKVECGHFIWMDGNTYFTSNNTATFILPNYRGCDSIINLDLTINNLPDVTTTLNGLTILANNFPNNSYQWIDCDSMANISGETASSFTAIRNGNYAVEIIENGCADTSICHSIISVGKNENTLLQKIKVYPNPIVKGFKVDFLYHQNEIVLNVISPLGAILFSNKYNNVKDIILELNHPKGLYFLEIISPGKERFVTKLIKE